MGAKAYFWGNPLFVLKSAFPVAVLLASALVSSGAEVSTLTAQTANTVRVGAYWQGTTPGQRGQRPQGFGSGVYLGAKLILTCNHVFTPDPGDGQLRAVRVFFSDGEIREATIAHRDAYWDQLVLELDAEPRSARGAPIAERDVKAGEFVTFGGFGPSGRLMFTRGAVVQFVSPGREFTEAGYLEAQGRSRDGDSGGPVFNDAGEVIGNLWGSDAGRTTALMCYRTRRFLAPFFPRITLARQRWSCRTPAASAGTAYPQACAPPCGQMQPLPIRSRPTTPPPAITVNYQRLAAELKSDPKFLAIITGPAGPPGQPGQPGQPGEPGPPGQTPTVDVDAIATAAAAKIDVQAIASAVASALPGGGQLTSIRVDQTDGRIYATYSDGREEPIGEMPATPPVFFDITKRKPK